jgi:hypothetical protein
MKHAHTSDRTVPRRILGAGALIVAMAFRAAPAAPQSAVKINAAALLLGVPHLAAETVHGKHTTFQLDVAASLWQSIKGQPFEVLMGIGEVRRYGGTAMQGPYVGVHLGVAVFRLQKWNYWGTSKYQAGRTALAGVTVGWAQRISETVTLDWFIGGGNQQALYRGFDAARGDAEYVGLNRSGEWLPYRGGVMVSIRRAQAPR